MRWAIAASSSVCPGAALNWCPAGSVWTMKLMTLDDSRRRRLGLGARNIATADNDLNMSWLSGRGAMRARAMPIRDRWQGRSVL
jgi:hypothetical protein